MKFVNYDVVNQIKKNVDHYLKFFSEKDYEKKLNEEFGSNYYNQTMFEYFPIDYYMPKLKVRKRKESDFKNAIKIYETYENLTEAQAADERFWCGLAIEKNNMDYLFYRWGQTKETIRYRVVYHSSGKRGMLYHGLARLWWLVKLTIDDTKENKYELTEFIFKYPHIMEKMIYRNFSNSENIRTAIIIGVENYIDKGGIYDTKLIDNLYLHISLLGGTLLLDAIPLNQLSTEVTNFLNLNGKKQ